MLRISLLGGFKVFLGETPVTAIKTPRLKALLAYLLLHRDAPQPRQHIAFLFWPDSLEAQAQSNLRNLLMALRHALPSFDEYVRVERQTLQWRSDSRFTLDVAEFEEAMAEVEHLADASVRAMQKVGDMYAGDLLPGCYDEWIAGPRERLRLGFLSATEKLIDALESAGELSIAILYAQRVLRHDAFSEERYRRLMRLHLAQGDLAGVMGVYRNCKRMLKRELDLEPSHATNEIARRAEQLLVGAEQVAGRQSAKSREIGGGKNRVGSRVEAPANLPAQTTAFIGREREVLAVTAWLRRDEVRLITLTGVAGVGKTRLGIRVASSLVNFEAAGPFPDGVWFVNLAPLVEADAMVNAIAQVFRVAERGDGALWEQVLEYLRTKQLVLLLDNFEHILPAAPLVGELLARCPGVKMLVTSRAVLNLRGEREYIVPPMGVPDVDNLPLPDELAQYEAVALFMERALEVSPEFALSGDNAKAIAEICRRLEGLPLAIELAAARVKVLTPEAILSRLDRRLKLLVGGRIDLPARQRALETTIAWSYNLLSEPERALFRKLAVFSGGCTLDAAEEIVKEADVLEGISALVSKSLLRQERAGTAERPPRFSMLETITEYAHDRLQESGEEEALRREHAIYFMRLAEEAEAHLVGSEEVAWLAWLEDEHDNLRAALRWAREAGKGGEQRRWTMDDGRGAEEPLPMVGSDAAKEATEIGLRMVGALWRFWLVRGYHSEGREHVAQMLAVGGAVLPPVSEHLERYGQTEKSWQAIMAKALYVAARLAFQQDDHPACRSFYERSLAISREIGDRQGVASTLQGLGAVAQIHGDYVSARSYYEQGLTVRREIGDKQGMATSLQGIATVALIQRDYATARELFEEALTAHREVANTVGMGWSLYYLGVVAQLQEDHAAARELFERAIAAQRQVGHRGGVAQTLGNMASVASSEGDYASARSLYRQSLDIRHKSGDRYGIAVCLLGVASVAMEGASEETLEEAQHVAGARLLGHSEALLEAIGAVLVADERHVYERGVAAARHMLDEAVFAGAWAEGRNMSMEEAIALAQSLC